MIASNSTLNSLPGSVVYRCANALKHSCVFLGKEAQGYLLRVGNSLDELLVLWVLHEILNYLPNVKVMASEGLPSTPCSPSDSSSNPVK